MASQVNPFNTITQNGSKNRSIEVGLASNRNHSKDVERSGFDNEEEQNNKAPVAAQVQNEVSIVN